MQRFLSVVLNFPYRMNKPSSSEDTNFENPALLKFHKEDFGSRLEAMIQRTHEYRGALPETWEKIRAGTQQQTKDVKTSAKIERQAVQHISDLVKRVRNADMHSIVIEASHAYLYDRMDNQEFLDSMETQYLHANKLAELLEKNRIAVRKVLFIDDYNPPPDKNELVHNLDFDAYLEFARDHGYYPDYLVMEADMERLARELITYMHDEQGLVLKDTNNGNGNGNGENEDEERQLLKRRGVELVKGSGAISCAGLDAALSIIKFHHMASGIVNVLPKHQGTEGFSFKGQQRKVRQILGEHLNVRVLPFFNIFTSDHPHIDHSSGAHSQFRKRNKKKS